MPDQPAIGIGHVVLTVGDVGASTRFYAGLGLRRTGDELTILELRGGTHLPLVRRKDGAAAL